MNEININRYAEAQAWNSNSIKWLVTTMREDNSFTYWNAHFAFTLYCWA